MFATVCIVAGLVLLYAVTSMGLARRAITAPMVFVAAGLLLSPHGIGLIDFEVPEGLLHHLAELTLVLVLFSDASRIDVGALRRELGLPARLLLVGLPLCVLLGGGVAMLVFPEWSVWSCLLLGAMLAPTDAALGQAVVSDPGVPQRIRQALNVESGLNDGVAVPLVSALGAMAALAAGLDAEASRDTAGWTIFAGQQIGFGVLVGAAVGGLGGALVTAAAAREWVDETMERATGLALPLLAWAGASLIGGNGFIAAFVGGLTLGVVARPIVDCLHDFMDTEGELLMLLVFFALGLSFAWPALVHGDGAVWLYALLSLTVIRVVPAMISLAGSGIRLGAGLFLGWFGPRGLATVVFAIIVADLHLPHGERIFQTAMLTVMLSVFAHGLTATPAAAFYARRMRGIGPEHPEMQPVTPHRLRPARSTDPEEPDV